MAMDYSELGYSSPDLGMPGISGLILLEVFRPLSFGSIACQSSFEEYNQLI
jgi:hypothetical protein